MLLRKRPASREVELSQLSSQAFFKATMARKKFDGPPTGMHRFKFENGEYRNDVSNTYERVFSPSMSTAVE